MNTRTKTDVPDTTPTRRKPSPKQADLFIKFRHLDRQRQANQLAIRILKILSVADPDVAEIAIEIAATSVRMKGEADASPAPGFNRLDGGPITPTQP